MSLTLPTAYRTAKDDDCKLQGGSDVPAVTPPSVESLIEDLKVELEASVHICDVLQDALNKARDQKNEVLRKLTNLRMAAIAQEKGGPTHVELPSVHNGMQPMMDKLRSIFTDSDAERA